VGWLYRAAVLVAVLALAGRVLGFLRDVLIAQLFGASAETDAFLVAWTVPETAGPLLLESAVIYAAIPILVRAQEVEGTPRGAIERSIGPIVIALLAVTIIVALAAPLFVSVLTPELVEYDLAVRSVRVAALTIVAFGIAGYLIAALRSKEIFGIPATTAIVYNVGIIATILLLEPELGIFSAAIGLAVGAVGMVIVQLPSYQRHIGWPRWSRGSFAYVAAEFSPFIPIAIFVLLRHAQVYVERFIGSFIEPGAISLLNYAERVTQVPLGITVAIAVVSFPAVARLAALDRLDELRSTFSRDLRLVAIVIVPATALLVVFARPVIEVVFERGSFTASDTAATSDVMELYALGLVAQAMIAIAVLPVYSFRRHMAAPIAAAGAGLAVTIASAAALVPLLDVPGLGLASAIGITVMALDMLRRVRARVLAIDLGSLGRDLVKLVIAAAAAAGVARVAAMVADAPLAELAIGGAVFVPLYLGLTRAFGIEELSILLRPVRRMLDRT
jgi:murein biosynthesis integral membrane protein MurJ